MTRTEVWASGDPYERYVGRWSRLVARDFLAWLDLPAGLAWLDVGCGTGALASAVLADAAPKAVIGLDSSDGFLALARSQIADPRARFERGSADALPLPSDAMDVAISGLVLNFVPDPAAMVREMRRVVRPGGTVALYVWDYAGEMQLMRQFWDAAAALDPKAAELDEGRRFPICRPAPLAELLRASGLGELETSRIDVPTVFAGFDEFWAPFLGGQGPAPTYAMSLPDQRRDRLRERLRAALPTEPDGRISLIARAFAVRGTVPA